MVDLEGATVLVTGGAGFIGSLIIDRLVNRADVCVVDHFVTGDPEDIPDAATVIERSVTNDHTLERAIDGVDVVFHKAAQTNFARSMEEPRRFHATNVDWTLAVPDAAREDDARAVVASSAAAYGPPERIPIRGSDQLSPTSPYGIEKFTVDYYARTYSSIYEQDVVARRYFNVYGRQGVAGDYASVIATFLDQISDDPIRIHGDGTQIRDFVHIDDVVDANQLAAETAAVGEAYNIGTGSPTTINELAEICKQLTDSEVKIIHDKTRQCNIEHSQAGISKGRSELGCEPTVSLDEELSRLVSERN